MFSVIFTQAQELVNSYYYADGYSIIPNSILEREHDIVVPYSITKNNEKKAGILYLNKDNSIRDAILFEGKNNYVINELIESKDGNLLVSAEGYSEEGQESIYFIELNDNEIVNEFVFNENGNELDPFAILEVDENVLIGGFVKSRELVSNSFYNMYTETQMIYVGEFTKLGSKVWSKGIELEGYDRGICNSMVKVKDGIVLLCHANKIGGKMYSILIQLDNDYSISKIVSVSNSDFITIGSAINYHSNVITLLGQFSSSEKNYLFKSSFSDNIEFINSTEYNIEGKYVINEFRDGIVLGSANNEGYNNLILNFDTYSESGNDKSNILVGSSSDAYFGYTIGSSIENTSMFDIYKKTVLEKKENLSISDINLLNIASISNYNIISEFAKSTINKGVSKIKIVNVHSKILQK